MPEYRESTDLFEEESQAVGDGGEEDVEREYTPSSPDLNENAIDDEVVTAVLLIMNKQGAVLPVTNLDSLKMERQANAHEVLRMCADVQDQISAIRVVGELAQIFQHVNQSSLKAVAEMMNLKVNGGKGED